LIALISQPSGLEPGDVIRINLYEYTSGSFRTVVDTFPVDSDGMVFLPYVGRTEVVGLSIPELEEKLYSEFSLYLREPNLIITPLHKITVLGHIRSPGIYLADRTSTVAKLIARAGGPTEIGDIGRVKVQREGESFGVKLSHSMGDIIDENGMSLRSGDILYVPRKFWPTWSELNIMLSLILASYSIYRIVTTD
jgi:polysaccharide export outer membrane protein